MTVKFQTLHCANGQTWIQARVQFISLHIAISFAVAIKYTKDAYGEARVVRRGGP